MLRLGLGVEVRGMVSIFVLIYRSEEGWGVWDQLGKKGGGEGWRLVGLEGYGEGTVVVEYVPITCMADQFALYSYNGQVR